MEKEKKQHLVVDNDLHEILKERADKKGRKLYAEVNDLIKKGLQITEKEEQQ